MFKTANWFIPAVLSLLLWGVWGFFQKLALIQMPPRNVYIFTIIGMMIVSLSVLVSLGFKVEGNKTGVFFAVLAGLCGSLGGLFYLYSLSKGKASVVITLTALYPVVTIILSFLILKESITIRQGIGIILALLAMVFLSE